MAIAEIQGGNGEYGLMSTVSDRLQFEVTEFRERYPSDLNLQILELSLKPRSRDAIETGDEPFSLEDLEGLYMLFVETVNSLEPQTVMPTFSVFCDNQKPSRANELDENAVVSAVESLILGEIPGGLASVLGQYRSTVQQKAFTILDAAFAVSSVEGDPLEDLAEGEGWEILGLNDQELASQNTDLARLILNIRSETRAGFCDGAPDAQTRAAETRRILKSRGLSVVK